MRRAAAGVYRFAFRGHPARAAVLSFVVAILAGTILLILPISSRARTWTAPVDGLFSATSAVCVTGLIVKSTPDHWSLFGQLTILALIQIGGLGIMTMGAFVAIMLRRKLSMRFETLMTDVVQVNERTRVGPLLRFICLFTLVAEVLGAVALFLAWRRDMPNLWRCIYQSVFHAISAFCNAGFSLNNDSLMRYADRWSVNSIVCTLIVVGGIGFVVVQELIAWAGWRLLVRRGRRPRLSVHSRLALLMTGVLFVLGFAVILCIEPGASLAGAGPQRRLLSALFQSVTPRTAGFNTMDMNALAPATVFVLMVLMYIGGCPSGTAGGVKTTTVGIMMASIMATLRGQDKAEMFNHSVPQVTVHRVASIILLSLAVLAGGVFVLLITEAASFQQIAFEAVSAFGTVGLSRGLTGPGCDLTAAGKLVITVLMFVGRLGPVALILSVASTRDRGGAYRYPEGQVLVG